MLDTRITDAMFALLRTVFNEDEKLDDGQIETIQSHICDLYHISKRSDMAHLVGYALEKNELISPDNEYFAKFQQQEYLSIVRCERMEYELERIRETFEKNEISFIPLKGSVIRSMYPEGWMRTSYDIDVLVRPEDIDRAQKSLIDRLGYRLHTEGRHDVSLYSNSGVHVELHFDLIEDDRANKAREVLLDVWKYASVRRGCKYENALSDGMFYFYHIAHMAKHVEAAGTGMRSFLDLWILNNYKDRNDAERAELLGRCSLDKFSGLCGEVSAHWFDGKTSMSEMAGRLEQFVLNCGTYGSEENWVLANQERSGSHIKYILSRLFLRYDVIKQLYPILRKHKWLTPLFEVVRWFKLLSGKIFKKAIREIRISGTASKSGEQTMKSFMSEIGL